MKRLLCFSLIWWVPLAHGATILVSDYGTQDGLNRDDVVLAIAAAATGDTVQMSSGTVSWTSKLVITKSVTLRGNTIVTGAGTASPVVVDNTIIEDNTPRPNVPATSGLILMSGDSAQNVRITGLTFTRGLSDADLALGSVRFASTGNAPNYTQRVDHCHFLNLQDRSTGTGGWSYAIIDNNVFNQEGNHQTCEFNLSGYGGATDQQCDIVWTEEPRFGGPDFVFFETNTVISSTGLATNGSTDASHGARFVIRYNFFKNTRPGWHGTEGGRARGTRAAQIYGNEIFFDRTSYSASNRSGVAIYHDNTFSGTALGINQQTEHSNLVMFRMDGAAGVQGGTWGAPGFSPFDQNSTRSDGTWHEGESPFVFFTGTDTGSVNTQGQMQDSNANFGGTDNLIGYSVRHTRVLDPDYLDSSVIQHNTPTTTDQVYYGGGDRGPGNIWNTGDTYAIGRALVTLDQQGRGKGDRLSGTDPINTVYGDKRWPHQTLEPCLSWNNLNTFANKNMGFGYPLTNLLLPNRDFYNFGPLGGGLGVADPQTIPTEVRAIYNVGGLSGINGRIWTSEYTYPHPIAADNPGPRINLFGDLNFGNGIIGDPPIVRTVSVVNEGDALLTVTSVNYTPSVFTGPTDSFALAPGNSVDLDVAFNPVAVTHYSGTVTFNSDAVSGNEVIPASGDGVAGAGTDRPYTVFQIIRRVLSKWIP